MSVLFLILAFLFGEEKTSEQPGKVVISVRNVDLKKGGELSAALFNKRNFPKAGRHMLGIQKSVSSGTMELVFESVPPGQYGIAVFQDIDKNRELNTNFIGIPTEPFGFSNDAKIRFGPPAFDDARINVEAGKELNLVIHLR